MIYHLRIVRFAKNLSVGGKNGRLAGQMLNIAHKNVEITDDLKLSIRTSLLSQVPF